MRGQEIGDYDRRFGDQFAIPRASDRLNTGNGDEKANLSTSQRLTKATKK